MYLVNFKKFRIEAGWFSADSFRFFQICIWERECTITTLLHIQFLKFSFIVYWG
jgi:hypothetical protein